jgi:soluble lytic murein transglycosylase-like protein
MNRLLAKAGLLILVAAAYVAAPFVSAWSIREAVRNGDSAYLERAVDWPSIRVTLAPSIKQLALDLPPGAAEAEAVEKLTVWQRVKAYFGAGAINTAIESYVTPEGFSQLFQIRKAYREYVSGLPDESTMPVLERIKRAWARVKRAEFTSATTFEVDTTDKLDETRLYLAKFELSGFGWVLKELRIRTLTAADSMAVKFADIAPKPTTVWDGLRAGGRGDR